MARPSSADPPANGNGAINRRHENSAASGGASDEQTLADSEQTLADAEQTLADSDQTSAERDQSGADSDQVASDRDQAASDRDLAHGADSDEHDANREIRRRSTRQREQTATGRLDVAEKRDATAHARDQAGAARDRAATARDLAMTQRDADFERHGAVAVADAQIVVRSAAQRERAAEYRAQAADYRSQAVVDRAAAATDREQGARDRLQACADREALARALAITETDPLTGARTRAAGLADLDRELDRCNRTGSSLVVAYVDAVGLKHINDSEGHDAGDRLLKGVVTLITEHLRSYDLAVRVGGDEFLCAMSNMTLLDARERFSTIAAAVAASHEAGAIRVGIAERRPDEASTQLVARADQELVASRRD